MADTDLSTETLFELLRARQFEKLIQTLREPCAEESEGIESVHYKMLSYAYLEIGKFAEAEASIEQAYHFNPSDPEVANGMAFFALRKNNVQEAIDYLLDALYESKDHPQIKRNLDALKGVEDGPSFLSLRRPTDFVRLDIPKPTFSQRITYTGRYLGKCLRSRAFLYLLGFGAIGLGGLLAYWFYPELSSLVVRFRAERGLGVPRILKQYHIQNLDDLVNQQSTSPIQLNQQDIAEKLQLINAYMQRYEHNRALYLINEILHSNADEVLKERMLILLDVLPDAPPDVVDFMPRYPEIIQAPFLYQGMLVRWNGTIANLNHQGRESTRFDLLIDFVDQATVKGIAHVQIPGFHNVAPGQTATVLGEIQGVSPEYKVLIQASQVLQ